MSDIKMDLDTASPTYGDILVDANGTVVLTVGLEAIRQNLLQRLRVFRGEWFLDNTIGLPYFQQILVKNPDQAKIDALLINQILSTPGVIQLVSFSSIANFTNRTLQIAFEVITTSGRIVYPVSEPLSLMI